MLGQAFPDLLRKWDKCELRGLVIISLVSQMILLHLGDHRRKRIKTLTKFLIWSAFIIADKAATVALGIIVGKLADYYYTGEKQKADINPQVMSLWASIFLLHLGGPDTITAYALEDNELWQRHLVGLVFQTVVVIYIILMSWERTSGLSHISIVMLIIGFFKYGEKTLCLYSSSITRRRDSLASSFSQIDSDGNYKNSRHPDNSSFLKRLLQPFFRLFVSLFIDVVLSTKDLQIYRSCFESFGPNKAFAIVEAELRLANDFFYTKASVAYGSNGLGLRLLTSAVTAGICIYLFIHSRKIMIQDSIVDWILSCMLMVGATYSECFAIRFGSLVTGIIFPKQRRGPRLKYMNGRRVVRQYPKIHFEDPGHPTVVSRLIRLSERESWSRSLGQCNLLSLYAENNNEVSGIPLSIKELENLLQITLSPISEDLKKIIYDCLQKKSKAVRDGTFPYGGKVRDSIHHICAEFQWTDIQWTERFEFHQSILTWHIAMDLCYHFDDNNDNNRIKSSLECKKISDYMFFLLVKRRYMLPVGTGMVRFYDTCSEAIKHFHRVKQSAGNQCEAFKKLVESERIHRPNSGRDKGTKSVFLHACKLAKSLLEKDRKKLWKFLTGVWIEILCYAAAHCKVDNHAQQLRRGGEFLTHVWLLQAHMGLLEQFQEMEEDVAGEDIAV